MAYLGYSYFVSKTPNNVTYKNDRVSARCASGAKGVIREETWSQNGVVFKYILAFVVPSVQYQDNGRILGYDNAHGHAERHFKGTREQIAQASYDVVLERFLQEVTELRRTL